MYLSLKIIQFIIKHNVRKINNTISIRNGFTCFFTLSSLVYISKKISIVEEKAQLNSNTLNNFVNIF